MTTELRLNGTDSIFGMKNIETHMFCCLATQIYLFLSQSSNFTSLTPSHYPMHLYKRHLLLGWKLCFVCESGRRTNSGFLFFYAKSQTIQN